MIITGLDLSLASTGYARIDTLAGHVTTGRIQSKGTKTATIYQRSARLYQLVDRIVDVAETSHLIVVEGPSFGQARQSGQHDRAGLWWLVVSSLTHDTHAPDRVVEVPPAVVKKYATGKGNADKDSVLLAVARRFPDIEITGNDEADALILAAMGARHAGHPIDDMPLTHQLAMSKVAWPTTQEVPY